MDIIQEAINKLNKESNETPATKVFAEYLKSKTQSDINLAGNIIKQDKSLKNMLEYIKENAKKKAANGFACIEDSTVFKWTENYFGIEKPEVNESDIEAAAKAVSDGASTVIKEKPKKPKKDKVNVDENQISLLDMLGADL